MNDRLWLHRRLVAGNGKIDIGCGRKAYADYVGIDAVDFGQPVVWDVREGIPFPNRSIIAVYSSHFIEHLADTEVSPFFEELLRVCKPGASVAIKCPHRNCKEAYYHNHLSLWSQERFTGICSGFSGLAKPKQTYFRIVRLANAGIEVQCEMKVEEKL